jgi:serine/threonine-protein kinase
MGELNEYQESRYLIFEPLGTGGSGDIFRAWDHKLGRMVALKRLKDNPGISTSIRHEAEVLASLDHPNIVSFLDCDSDEKGHFVVMELVYGRTLDEIVFEQPLSVAEFIPFMNQVCQGMATAHAFGLIHCDLKPGNIILESNQDGSFTAKILDFGLATFSISIKIPDSHLYQARIAHGTPLTMSPEQLRGEPMDARSDIYSLGCTFYFALSGRYAHQAENDRSIVENHLYSTPKAPHLVKSDIPEPLSLAIMRLLANDREERPQDAESARLLLEAAAHSL